MNTFIQQNSIKSDSEGQFMNDVQIMLCWTFYSSKNPKTKPIHKIIKQHEHFQH